MPVNVVKQFLQRRRAKAEDNARRIKQAEERCEECTPKGSVQLHDSKVQAVDATVTKVHSAGAPRVFHKFPELPGELRNKIWYLALDSIEVPRPDFRIILPPCLQINYLAMLEKRVRMMMPNIPIDQAFQTLQIGNDKDKWSYTLFADDNDQLIKAEIRAPQQYLCRSEPVLKPKAPSTAALDDHAHRVIFHERPEGKILILPTKCSAVHDLLGMSTISLIRADWRLCKLYKAASNHNLDAIRKLNIRHSISVKPVSLQDPGLLAACRESRTIARPHFIIVRLTYVKIDDLGFRFRVCNPEKGVYVRSNRAPTMQLGEYYSETRQDMKEFMRCRADSATYECRILSRTHSLLGYEYMAGFEVKFRRLYGWREDRLLGGCLHCKGGRG